ncbi:hypothetical protein DFR49_0969 [Hephaestia caeni]|uniref:Uncharacterized protein n=1 Tax=Hephaestia caeni TaxID=645617 RepID=A0A397PGZ0_9SPHN|nr:hypothetical protein DFR49_0969 [Hephaestia caeni]
MPRGKSTTIPAAPRKPLIEWIENDDGNTPGFTRPACSNQVDAFHARIFLDPEGGRSEAPVPLQPPSSLRLPPLG